MDSLKRVASAMVELTITQAHKKIQVIKRKQVALNTGFEKNKLTLSEYNKQWKRVYKELVKYQAISLVLGNKKSFGYDKNKISYQKALKIVRSEK